MSKVLKRRILLLDCLHLLHDYDLGGHEWYVYNNSSIICANAWRRNVEPKYILRVPSGGSSSGRVMR